MCRDAAAWRWACLLAHTGTLHCTTYTCPTLQVFGGGSKSKKNNRNLMTNQKHWLVREVPRSRGLEIWDKKRSNCSPCSHCPLPGACILSPSDPRQPLRTGPSGFHHTLNGRVNKERKLRGWRTRWAALSYSSELPGPYPAISVVGVVVLL